jgi:hypothetical protein
LKNSPKVWLVTGAYDGIADQAVKDYVDSWKLKGSEITKPESKSGGIYGLMLLLADDEPGFDSVDSLSHWSGNILIKNYKYIFQYYDPFSSGKQKRVRTDIGATATSSGLYYKRKKNKKEFPWYYYAAEFDKVMKKVRSLQKGINQDLIERFNYKYGYSKSGERIKGEVKDNTFDQNEYLFKQFSSNESLFRLLLLKSKLITLFPPEFILDIASRFNKSFTDTCVRILATEAEKRIILGILWKGFSENKKKRIKFFAPEVYKKLKLLAESSPVQMKEEYSFVGSPDTTAYKTFSEDDMKELMVDDHVKPTNRKTVTRGNRK